MFKKDQNYKKGGLLSQTLRNLKRLTFTLCPCSWLYPDSFETLKQTKRLVQVFTSLKIFLCTPSSSQKLLFNNVNMLMYLYVYVCLSPYVFVCLYISVIFLYVYTFIFQSTFFSEYHLLDSFVYFVCKEFFLSSSNLNSYR